MTRLIKVKGLTEKTRSEFLNKDSDLFKVEYISDSNQFLRDKQLVYIYDKNKKLLKEDPCWWKERFIINNYRLRLIK